MDIVAHAIDYPPPSTVILISGDRDFTYAVSTMRLRNYRVVLLAPAAAHSSLRTQASVVFEWPRSVLQAELPVPTSPPTSKSRPAGPHSLRPCAPIFIDRSRPYMIQGDSTSTTSPPTSSRESLLFAAENATSDLTHHRSTSLPNRGFAHHASSTGRPNYAAITAGARYDVGFHCSLTLCH